MFNTPERTLYQYVGPGAKEAQITSCQLVHRHGCGFDSADQRKVTRTLITDRTVGSILQVSIK